jgi:site-specific recombinase XerD
MLRQHNRSKNDRLLNSLESSYWRICSECTLSPHSRRLGKRSEEANTVLVSKRLEKALIAFSATYPRHITNSNAALFFSAKRGGFSAQTIVNLFARFYALTGIKGASSHSGRRQFLTELADKGICLRVIQALARHKDMSMTQRYIDCPASIAQFYCTYGVTRNQ